MSDSVFKQKYQKYKLRVKLWEKDFKKKHGRIPSKYDIREASQEIRDSYKMYYKLKTSFLEDTLNDVFFDDGFDVLEISQNKSDPDITLSYNINGGPKLPVDITKLVEQQQHSNIELPGTSTKNDDQNQVLKDFQTVENLSLYDKTWGPIVSKQVNKAVEDKSQGPRKSLKLNFKEKLFQNNSFSKRNPRKSFSKSSDNSLKSNQVNLSLSLNANKEVLPDLETILLQKAKEKQKVSTVVTNPLPAVEKSKDYIKTKIDEGWLERNAVQDGIDEKVFSGKKVEKDKENNDQSHPNSKRTYGLSNLDVTKFLLIPQAESSQLNKTSNNGEHELKKTEKMVNLSLESITTTQNKLVKPQHTDSDSIVDDSEGESESQEHRHIVKRRKITRPTSAYNEKHDIESTRSRDNQTLKDKDDEVHHQEKAKGKRKYAKGRVKKVTMKSKISKKETSKEKKRRENAKENLKSKQIKNEEFLEKEQSLDPETIRNTLVLERGTITSVPRFEMSDLDRADSLAQKYINNLEHFSDDNNSVKSKPVQVTDEKRAAAKRKLKEKIAAGKLNDNFVTINIQKKTFVRGKKSFNYSKYKRKQWKHKKDIASLTGPNMDMGGCDGGVYKCFNCGQAGHYAQNCKIKGDSLLPLTAHLEEDSSPFPTLEEADLMAKKTAIAVHSRNITNLPLASNAALYQINSYNCIEDNYNEKKDEVEGTLPENDTGNGNQQEEKEILIESDHELEYLDIDSVCLESQRAISPIKKYVGSKIPAEFLKAAGIDPNNLNAKSSFSQGKSVGPLYDLNPDGSVREVTPEVLDTLKMFGHTSFRKGQDRAVMRILSGMSTLVTLSTGSGKSLCYQLPAYLYSKYKKSITLVISPLVSLMEDQVTGVPHFLRAHCLHTNQTPQQKTKIMKIISDGDIDVLLVSPEAVVSGERTTGFGSLLRQLPPIAFACIDEAHCVSQWSHNFRPSYLMICKVLKQNLGINCVLGLTATATLPTRLSIINHLGILDGEKGIINDIPLPDNLILSVSKDENRDAALLQLLTSKRFEACQSIIIYCTRRDECERIASYLRTCLQDHKISEPENGKRKRKRVNWHAEPYHAGMPASRRRIVQNAFMSNELRIVVATIAFGMGINKPDIRAVIHYNMPRNFESYVQEVGRAGRDNKISHCHLFLDSNESDKNELKRHIYANSLDRHTIRKLLQHIFIPCSCDKNLKDNILSISDTSNALDMRSSKTRPHICPGHEIGFSIEKTVESLDIPEENISTLLCYMELDSRWCIDVLSNAYIKAKVISYGGPKYLKHAAKMCPPLAMAIAMEIKNGSFKEDAGIIEFSVIDVAAAIGWNSGVVKYQLKNLEWIQVNDYPKRSPITVNFYDLGFRIKAPGDFTAEEIDDALDSLYSRTIKQEQAQLKQLQYVFQGLSSVAYNTYGPCCSEILFTDRSDQLKEIIRDYFRKDYSKELKLEIDHSNASDSDLESDIIALINMYPENNFSGRNIAKIFHGIPSPNYPAQMWYRCKFWRVHSKTDFNRIVLLANSLIVKRRT